MISALYVREDSVYKEMGVDSWDINRDARLWPGGHPVIAHPPCGQWSRLYKFARPDPELKALALLAIDQVREWGGILEHPAHSRLWKEKEMPMPGQIDNWGGYTICVDQSWWGHPARKKTFLYIVGIPQMGLPLIPLSLDAIEYTVSSSIKKYSGRRTRKELPVGRRDITPHRFAQWLIEVASIIYWVQQLKEKKP